MYSNCLILQRLIYELFDKCVITTLKYHYLSLVFVCLHISKPFLIGILKAYVTEFLKLELIADEQFTAVSSHGHLLMNHCGNNDSVGQICQQC